MGAPKNPTVHHRRLGSVVYTAGGRQTLELDRDGVLLGLSIRLRFDLANGANAPTTPLFQTLSRLIKRLEVIAGGRDTVWSVSGAHLVARATYEAGIAPYGMDAALPAGNGASGSFDIVIPVDFTLPSGRRPDDTGLDTRGLNQLAVAVTWGSASDLFGTVNTAAVSNVTCTVEGRYMLNVAADRAYLVRALDTVERELTGSSDNWDMIMDRGTGLVYRSFMVVTTADSVGVNTILDPGTIKLESGSFIFQNRDAVTLRGMNKRDQRIAPVAGVYFVDVLFNGQITNGINTGALDADLKMIFNATKVNGTNIVAVQREAVRPLKLA